MRHVTYWSFPSAIVLDNGIRGQTFSVGIDGVTAIRVTDSGLAELDFATTTFVVGPGGGFGKLTRDDPKPSAVGKR